ncbi:hypothetical protein BJV77DRAFT_801692 [Russula vinacea]|nr:hypothetical protein BJV77DRAFT_801692 [Russula vinacea]
MTESNSSLAPLSIFPLSSQYINLQPFPPNQAVGCLYHAHDWSRDKTGEICTHGRQFTNTYDRVCNLRRVNLSGNCKILVQPSHCLAQHAPSMVHLSLSGHPSVDATGAGAYEERGDRISAGVRGVCAATEHEEPPHCRRLHVY